MFVIGESETNILEKTPKWVRHFAERRSWPILGCLFVCYDPQASEGACDLGLFGRNSRKEEFEHDVLTELAYLHALHGESAYEAAVERAERPRIGGSRRAVLQEAARRLAPTYKSA
jgi:hypothetical protein